MTSLIYVDEMKTHLCGMYWTPGKSPLAIPYFGSAFKSAMVFKQNLAEITWNCMRTLENNPTSLPQTRTILAGQSVGGISVFDLLQVKNYGDASKLLIDKVRSNTFALDKATACAIHNLSALEDALVWGTFRTGSVSIEGVEYLPPEASSLDSLAKTGLGWLNTAVANLPISVLNKQSERFHSELKTFYETSNADGMFAFFADIVTDLYSDLPKDELKSDPF